MKQPHQLPKTDIQHTLEFKYVFERFAPKVRIAENGCWEWTATKSRIGYGQFVVLGRKTSPHRFAYMWYIGAIPEDKEIDHLCNNRGCCNPAHLEAVTKSENHRRAFQRGRVVIPRKRATHCRHGHEYTPENTHIIKNKTSKGTTVQCKTCVRNASRARDAGMTLAEYYYGQKKAA